MTPAAHKTGPDWFAQVKAWPVADVAARFGLEAKRIGADVSFPCPACGKVRRHTKGADKRLAAKVVANGAGWWCEPCDTTGDAVTLAALVVAGKANPSKDKWPEVRRACADRGLCDAAGDGGPAPTVRLVKPPPPPVEVQPQRPPAAEVAALWGACLPLTAFPTWEGGAEWTGEARCYLASRRLDVSTLERLDVARLLPPATRCAFPAWWPSSWAQTWRLVAPAYEPNGDLASLHARAVGDADPKTRWPAKCAASGLLFADARGLALLRGDRLELEGALVAEGLTDFWAWCLWAYFQAKRFAVFGVAAGGARAFAQVRWPSGLPCYVAMDNDRTGDKYAQQVREALPATVEVRRVRFNEGGGR